MSISSWKKEFLPTPASKYRANRANPRSRPTPARVLAAARHSLAKWLGTRRADLKRHGVTIPDLYDARLLSVEKCALCQVSLEYNSIRAPVDCKICPLGQVRLRSGGPAGCGEIDNDSYISACLGENSTRLIRELRAAVKLAEREEKKARGGK